MKNFPNSEHPADGQPAAHSADTALLEHIAGGDVDAFEMLVRMYIKPLLAYASHMIGERAAAEELVQDVFCRLWDSRGVVRDAALIKRYLFNSVRNAALNYLKHDRVLRGREAKLEREAFAPGMGGANPDPAVGLEREELAAAISDAVASLPERRRQIVLLRSQQLSNAEIADVLQISVKTVEAQITQAYAQLRLILAPWGKR